MFVAHCPCVKGAGIVTPKRRRIDTKRTYQRTPAPASDTLSQRLESRNNIKGSVPRKRRIRKEMKKMRRTRDYNIDPFTNTVTVSKAFTRRAYVIDSEEYKTFEEWKERGFTITEKTVRKNANKEHHKGLTIEFMRNFISIQEDAEALKLALEHAIREFKIHPAYYSKVKSVFLHLCRDYSDAVKRSLDIYTKQKEVEDAAKNEQAPALTEVKGQTYTPPAKKDAA